jgi:hypothetical protein
MTLKEYTVEENVTHVVEKHVLAVVRNVPPEDAAFKIQKNHLRQDCEEDFT